MKRLIFIFSLFFLYSLPVFANPLQGDWSCEQGSSTISFAANELATRAKEFGLNGEVYPSVNEAYKNVQLVADKTDMKYGPGLLGLFKGQALPASGRPATEDNVRSQLITPFEKMPAFEELSEGQIADLIAYMRTL